MGKNGFKKVVIKKTHYSCNIIINIKKHHNNSLLTFNLEQKERSKTCLQDSFNLNIVYTIDRFF